jgi:hypothetical protein
VKNLLSCRGNYIFLLWKFIFLPWKLKRHGSHGQGVTDRGEAMKKRS